MSGALASDGCGMPPSPFAAASPSIRALPLQLVAILAPIAVSLALLAAPAGAAGPSLLTPFAGNGGGGSVVAGPALSTPLANTRGLTADADGNVYVTDSTSRRIDKITPGGTLSF